MHPRRFTAARATRPTRLLLLCAATSLVCCGPEIIQPTVEIEGIEEWELDLEGTRLVFGVEVNNPNPYGCDLVGAEYRLEFNGVTVGSGELDGEYEIAPAAVSRIRLPLELDLAALLEVILAGVFDELEYSLRGTARLKTVVGILEVPFEKTERVSIPQAVEDIF